SAAVLDSLENLHQPIRAFTTRRTPATGLVFIKLSQIFCRLEDINGLIHYDEATRSDTRSRGNETFIIHAHVFPDDLIGAHDVDRRATRNHGFQLLPVEHSAAVFHDELFHVVVTHRQFVNAGAVDVTGDGPQLRAATLLGPEFLIRLAAHLDDVRHGRKRLDVIDDSWSRVQTGDSREGRLHARMTA